MLLLVLTFTASIGLGIFVYLRGSGNEINKTVGMILCWTAFWTLGFFLFQRAQSSYWLLFFRRLTPAGAALIAGYFLYFALLFPKYAERPALIVRAAIFLPAYIFTLSSVFTNWMITGIIIDNPALPFLGRVFYGPIFIPFMAYFIGCAVLAFCLLVAKYLKAGSQEKNQIFYVLFGSVVALAVGIVTNFFLPLFGFAQLANISPLFALIMTVFISYAIVRHKLLNIDDFLSRGLYLFFIILAIVGTLLLLAMQKFNVVFPFYTVVGSLALGMIVYLNNYKSKINISFFALALMVVLWTVAIFFYSEAADSSAAFFWSKAAATISVCIPALILFFSYVFPKEEESLASVWVVIWVASAVVVAVLTQFNLVVSGVSGPPGSFAFVPGPAFPLFVVYFLGLIGAALIKLLRKYYHYSGTRKLQIRYVFVGLFLGSFFPIITNLVLPFLGFTQLAGIGPFFTIITSTFISYAIVRHRLMSIEVIIQRSTVYAFATILIMAFYALAVLVSEIYLRQVIGYTSLIISALAAMIIAVAYQPLVKSFQVFTDRIFFRGRYDYQKTLNRISQEIAAVIRLEELAKLIAFSFVDTMKVAEISFLLLEKEGEHFCSIPLNIARYKRIEIDVQSPIVTWLNKNRDILVREEVEAAPELEIVQGAMDRLGISVWVPIVSKDVMIGIIALGDKLSGDVFSAEDLALLNTLASQTAVALDNARLYDEVLTMKNYSEEILQSMNNGVLTTDLRGKIITINYMAERITGRKRSEVIGKGCAEIWGKKSMIARAAENTIKDVFCLNLETTVASPEKGLVPISLSSTVLRDSQGKKTGILLTIQDLTEIKELEDKVRRGDKLSALATMAAGMAHEIKNPLSSMKVFAQLLPKKFDDPEYRKKLEEILPREINRIDRIVESLLGFARATAMTFEKASLKELIEETVKYYEDQAKNNGVKIVRSFSNLPEIEVDKGQIAQVFSNLILNAIQAMPEGGELTIKTLPDKKDEDILRTIKVQISDTGHGISEEMQKKLFDPFFTTKYGGTGLGLTITHSIVDGHKGSIDLDSKIGQGTTFTITLPVRQGLL